MNKQTISSLGIDISKNFLDIYCLTNNYSARYENTPEGLEGLWLWLQSNPVEFIVFEPSGGYEKSLRVFLTNHQIGFSMINATLARHFAKAKGLLAKTDKIDAMALAEYGLTLQPQLFTENSPQIQELQEWLAARRKILEAKQFEQQRLEHKPSKEIEMMIHQTLEHFKVQQKIVDEKIQFIVKQALSFVQKKKSSYTRKRHWRVNCSYSYC
jgi:transposase